MTIFIITPALSNKSLNINSNEPASNHFYKKNLISFVFYELCPQNYINMEKAIIKTNKGEMEVEFYEKDTPNTVANFKKLAQDGYYNNLTWHRVIPNFVIQGGCPVGDGTGGPGYEIDCELEGDNQYHDRGVLSMAHSGRNTGGSQFFICHSRDNTAHLDRHHTVFGKVTKGLDVIDAIEAGDNINSIEITQ